MRFGTGNVRSLYRATTRVLVKHNLDLMAAKEAKWIKDCSQPFLYRNGNADHRLGTGFFVHQGIR